MKDEEVDWDVYHRIVCNQANTVSGIEEVCGLSSDVVLASVDRLKHYLLIKEENGLLHPLGIEEMLLSCRIRHAQDLPFTIENGVIKMKQED
ncbi:MarR family transcriptional regulator [Methanocalculus sp.]|uniref:MarR family transcriptional regulator n=1 Tax=Methanocalculus sp. TaxID=2004547 RepID=UPI0026288CA0|nr:MarR family transcriptional regulator [Methanocalculus sp.]MDG6250598.1 MarR family transcriptional regulator [Methanocalculus sp.]